MSGAAQCMSAGAAICGLLARDWMVAWSGGHSHLVDAAQKRLKRMLRLWHNASGLGLLAVML